MPLRARLRHPEEASREESRGEESPTSLLFRTEEVAAP
jgi:hypothetical protein